ncbi:MAG: hypothetical protein ACOY4I_01215 [Bacillota bacterium]
MEKKVRCRKCRKTIGVLKKDTLEIKCPHCGEFNLWDAEGKRVKLAGVIKKKKG